MARFSWRILLLLTVGLTQTPNQLNAAPAAMASKSSSASSMTMSGMMLPHSAIVSLIESELPSGDELMKTSALLESSTIESLAATSSVLQSAIADFEAESAEHASSMPSFLEMMTYMQEMFSLFPSLVPAESQIALSAELSPSVVSEISVAITKPASLTISDLSTLENEHPSLTAAFHAVTSAEVSFPEITTVERDLTDVEDTDSSILTQAEVVDSILTTALPRMTTLVVTIPCIDAENRVVQYASLAQLTPSLSSYLGQLEAIELQSSSLRSAENEVAAYLLEYPSAVKVLSEAYLPTDSVSKVSVSSVSYAIRNYPTLASCFETIESAAITNPSMSTIQSVFDEADLEDSSVFLRQMTMLDRSSPTLFEADESISDAEKSYPSIVTDINYIDAIELSTPTLRVAEQMISSYLMTATSSSSTSMTMNAMGNMNSMGNMHGMQECAGSGCSKCGGSCDGCANCAGSHGGNCGGSQCGGEGCGGSQCGGEGCGGSQCGGENCGGSQCGGEGCGGSQCGGENCGGSQCGGESCEGSQCGGENCAGSQCGGEGCEGSQCGGEDYSGSVSFVSSEVCSFALAMMGMMQSNTYSYTDTDADTNSIPSAAWHELESVVESHPLFSTIQSSLEAVERNYPSIVSDVSQLDDEEWPSLELAESQLAKGEITTILLLSEVSYIDLLEASYPSWISAESKIEASEEESPLAVSEAKLYLQEGPAADESGLSSFATSHSTLISALQTISALTDYSIALARIQDTVESAEQIVPSLLTDVSRIMMATSPSQYVMLYQLESLEYTLTSLLSDLSYLKSIASFAESFDSALQQVANAECTSSSAQEYIDEDLYAENDLYQVSSAIGQAMSELESIEKSFTSLPSVETAIISIEKTDSSILSDMTSLDSMQQRLSNQMLTAPAVVCTVMIPSVQAFA